MHAECTCTQLSVESTCTELNVDATYTQTQDPNSLLQAHETKLNALVCNLQVIEFVDFKQRLERSHTLAVTTSEQCLIRIRKAIPRGFASVQSALQEASKDQAQSSELPSVEQLRFNEDLSTRSDWLPPHGGPVGGALIDWWHAQHFTTHDPGMVWLHNGSSFLLSLLFSVTIQHKQLLGR